jgi:hypothetical protein
MCKQPSAKTSKKSSILFFEAFTFYLLKIFSDADVNCKELFIHSHFYFKGWSLRPNSIAFWRVRQSPQDIIWLRTIYDDNKLWQGI